MTRNRILTFIARGFVLFSIALIMSACGSPKLIDIDKTSTFLNLSKEQLKVVQPKMEKIKTIVSEYDAEKEEFENELKELQNSRIGGRGSGARGGSIGSGQSGLREKLSAFRKKRARYQGQINVLVAEIKASLDKEQLKKFEKIKMPKLEMPEFGGGRQRGGRGFGGGRGRGFGGGRGRGFGGGQGGGGFTPF